jgi:hypothetical protein
MTLLLTTFIMIAFAAVYAGLLAMIGHRAEAIATALFGQRTQAGGGDTLAASRRFSRA